MRLLHTAKYVFQIFESTTRPKYAILSHRWGNGEVSYQDYREGKTTTGPGYSKILELCRLARSRGHQWAWIDTCCIDKSSSAELTESINSMWSYYRDAAECYAYLADVPDWVQTRPATMTRENNDQSVQLDREAFAALRASDWFSRGWTLQELIAPDHVLFCTSTWRILGSKAELARDLSTITGIQETYLNSPDRVREASIATRMSWASRRMTTRTEDIAYCLLGLFDVNMSMLYGEGMEAYMRLQRKIIKKYDDESIFAWAVPRLASRPGPAGMLATSPAAFALSKNIVTFDVPPEQKLQYQITNKGLELSIPSSIHEAISDETSEAPETARDRWRDKWQSQSEPSFRRPRDDLINTAWRRGYTPLATKAPIERTYKKFQLACGSPRHGMDEVDLSEHFSKDIRVIGITLTLTNRGWQRAWCDQLETWPELVKKDGYIRSLYYVIQGNLRKSEPEAQVLTPPPKIYFDRNEQLEKGEGLEERERTTVSVSKSSDFWKI